MNNLKINEEANEATISLNKKFYDNGCVVKGKEDFESICEIDLKEDANRILVTIKPKEKGNNLKQLCLEFCNYVFDVMKNGQH